MSFIVSGVWYIHTIHTHGYNTNTHWNPNWRSQRSGHCLRSREGVVHWIDKILQQMVKTLVTSGICSQYQLVKGDFILSKSTRCINIHRFGYFCKTPISQWIPTFGRRCIISWCCLFACWKQYSFYISSWKFLDVEWSAVDDESRDLQTSNSMLIWVCFGSITYFLVKLTTIYSNLFVPFSKGPLLIFREYLPEV